MNVATILFSIYIIFLEDQQIRKNSKKISHSWISLEWQLIKKYNVNDFYLKKTNNNITVKNIIDILGEII